MMNTRLFTATAFSLLMVSGAVMAQPSREGGEPFGGDRRTENSREDLRNYDPVDPMTTYSIDRQAPPADDCLADPAEPAVQWGTTGDFREGKPAC